MIIRGFLLRDPLGARIISFIQLIIKCLSNSFNLVHLFRLKLASMFYTNRTLVFICQRYDFSLELQP